ncbi:hypothetical protein RHMOL_Rhmol11G0040900 [Rhododendron molle]|uniref:Uncharacterized protein n=1 Tax=Rhododendron molle TaxID=49168 RepID=A0ACC0LPP7_RHOML|nr:hypothetical protein RHMOL_Rhmol11G0040900 [Rhododendron molle]
MGNPVFEVGMEFKTHAQFRDAVKEHSIKGGKEITFLKSYRDKVRAKCRVGCPWLIYASYVPSDAVYRIKRYDIEHSCNRSFHVPWVSTKWILNKYKERIRRNPTWPVKSLADTIMGEHTVNVDIQKVYRARKMALEMIQGSAVVKKRDAMKRCKWTVCPKVYKRVGKLKESLDGWIPRWQGSDRFEVEGPALNFLNKDIYDYVHECYKVNTYLQTYNNLMNPINGRELRPENENPTLLPPDVEKRVGRPKKARRREPEELADPKKLRRKGIEMTCKECGIAGHNKRTCKKQKTTTTASGGGESSRVGATAAVGPNEANPAHSIVSAIVCGSSANRNATHGSNANSNAVKRPKVTISTNKDMFFCSKSLTYVFFSPTSASLWE